MLHSNSGWPGIKIYSSIQKLVDEYQDAGVPGSRLLLLAGLRELVLQMAGRFGYEVVNADNLQEFYADRIKGQVVYYSVNPDNAVVRRHLGAGGMAVFIRDGKVLFANGCRSRIIIKTTPGGSNQLQDALAAAAGLMVLGVKPEELWRCKGHRNPSFVMSTKN